jgi:hypothetical protein
VTTGLKAMGQAATDPDIRHVAESQEDMFDSQPDGPSKLVPHLKWRGSDREPSPLKETQLDGP